MLTRPERRPAHRLSFDVQSGELEVYRATISYPHQFRFNGFDVLGPRNTPVGALLVDWNFDGVPDVTIPLRSLGPSSAYADVIPDGRFTPGLEPMLGAGGRTEFTLVLPFGGDANPDTVVAPRAARITVVLFPGLLTNPDAGGSHTIRAELTSVDPDTDGPDDGAGSSPSTTAFAIGVSIASSGDVLGPLFLHGSGGPASPAALFLDGVAPTSPTARFRDAPVIRFSGGNPWQDVGTWRAAPGATNGVLSGPTPLHVWIGLRNSDDQGTRFDLRVDVEKNGATVATGTTRCITGLTRNPALATAATVTVEPVISRGLRRKRRRAASPDPHQDRNACRRDGLLRPGRQSCQRHRPAPLFRFRRSSLSPGRAPLSASRRDGAGLGPPPAPTAKACAMRQSVLRASPISRLGLVFLALTPLLGGCAFLQFTLAIDPRDLAVLPGDTARVTVTADPMPLDLQEPPCDSPGFCVDVIGQVFDYVVQGLPTGVSYDVDASLRSPSTPGVVRISFHASASAPPGVYSVGIQAVLIGHRLGETVLTLRVLPASRAPATAPPVAIATGKDYFGDHSLVALADGSVRAWGFNGFGQLGDGTRIGRAAPVTVGNLDGIVAVAGGGSHSLGLTANGLVWAWGRNWFGQLGDASTTDRVAPVAVQGIHNVHAISAGDSHSLALRTDATVWAWGLNFDGRLGNGTMDRGRKSPAPVPGLSRIRAISAGEAHSLALDADGTVWAWGANGYGQLGDGTTSARLSPQQVPGLGDIQAIAAGSRHSLAVAADGTVWAWGANGYGQLGDGTAATRSVPVQVPGLAGIRAVAGGQEHSLALAADGTVWAWGDNFSHQLGDGTDTRRNTPVQVQGLGGVRAIAASNQHSLALLDCGQLWAWGDNGQGQLGDGLSITRSTPVPVPGLADDGGCEQVALRVTLAGDGSGALASSPVDLSCDDIECIAIVDRGTPVTVTASPGVGSTFERWSLDCADTAPQTLLIMDASRHCAAILRDTGNEPYLLTVVNRGGLVTSTGGGIMGPDHIDCGEVCSAIFVTDSVVTVSAMNANGFRFAGWALDCSGTAPQTTVTMSAPRMCRADFLPFSLGVSVTGSGVVTSNPAGITCGQTCAFTPRTGAVMLTAAPEVGWQFDGWSGDCAGVLRETSVAMDADKSCLASFSQVPGQVFTLTVTTTGNGHVSSVPAGIDCGADCEEVHVDGTLVTLTATPDPGFRFDGWSEDCEGTDRDAQVVMDADRTCHASFSPDGGPFTLTIAINEPPGSLGAIIGVQPPGNPINCQNGAGPVCAQAFAAGTIVVVRPNDVSLETGLFANWLGCDTVGALFQCAVVMTGNRTVTATFAR